MNRKEKLIKNFNPNGVGAKGSLFGLPFELDDSDFVLIPVPWEVTASYGSGTSLGPEAILNASTQLDFGIVGIQDAWKIGMFMFPIDPFWKKENDELRLEVSQYLTNLERGDVSSTDFPFDSLIRKVDHSCLRLKDQVKMDSMKLIDQGKMVALVGGDHSVSLGLLEALDSKGSEFGVLQIDAHPDLRKKFEGFEFSHASIMYHALKLKNLNRLVQVGIRDFSREETERITNSKGKILTFWDDSLKAGSEEGKSWLEWCEEIIGSLPQNIYVTIDIDGLDPKLCPNTGTPVPGGLNFFQLSYLIEKLVRSGKRIIGFDLCEVSPGESSNEFDGNVGARIIYRMASYMAISQGKLDFEP